MVDDDRPGSGLVGPRRGRRGRLERYDAVPNITPVTLLTLHLPIVDPENTESYLLESDRARRALRLNRAWYARMEHHRAPHDKALDFYDHMREEFARFTSGRATA